MQIKEIKNMISRYCVAFTLMWVSIAFCSVSDATDLQPGQKYKIIKSIYITGVYNSLEDRRISKETARAHLGPVKVYFKKSWYGFQREVPVGTVMTIISEIPKRWYHFFSAKSYLVRLNPDLSQELDVEIELARGFEGNLDGLNSEIFSRE